MSVTRIRRGVAAAAAVAATLSGAACSASAANPATDGQVEATMQWALLDADSHGAVVLGTSLPDHSSRLFGVDRNGVVAWQANALASRVPMVVCSGRCPVAIASSSLRSANELRVPDERPVRLGDPSDVSFAIGHKTSVLSSSPLELVQEVTDAQGRSELRMQTSDAVRSTAISGWGTRWRGSNDGTVAVALTNLADGQGIDVRVFVADLAGWRMVGGVDRSNSMFGCAAAGGRHLIVSDPTPTIVAADGGVRTKITGLEAGGDCGFVADGAVVAEYAASGSERQTKIVSVDLAGKMRSEAEYPFEARISTDLGGRGYLTVLQGNAEERDLAGHTLQKIKDVVDARYAENSEIVSVSASGDVRWTAGLSRQ
jgi:hypothetical protein